MKNNVIMSTDSSRRVLLDRQLKNPNRHYTLRREQGSKSSLKSTNCNKCGHNLNNYLVTLMLQRIRHCTHRKRGREEKEKRMSSLLLRSFISKLAIASDVQKTEDCSYTTAAALLCCIPRFPNTSLNACKNSSCHQHLICYHHRNNLQQLLPALIVLSPPSIQQQKQQKQQKQEVSCGLLLGERKERFTTSSHYRKHHQNHQKKQLSITESENKKRSKDCNNNRQQQFCDLLLLRI